jgi:hypothetical protein
MTYSRAQVLVRIARKISNAQDILDLWMERCKTDPAYAFEWGNDAAMAASRISTWKAIETAVAEKDYEYVISNLRSLTVESLRKGCQASSTSQMSNIMERNRGLTFSEALQEFEYLVYTQEGQVP